MLLQKYSTPDFPSLVDNFFSRDWMDWSKDNFFSESSTLPAVNVVENDDAYEIELAAPGMKKDDFQIQLENNQLTISSEHKDSKEEKDKSYTKKEFSYQSFRRSFSVSEKEVKTEMIKATYDDGILHITLPKADEVKPKPPKQIEIK